MPHDQVEVVVSLSLSTHHNMVSQRVFTSASLNTKHPTEMHSTCWFHLELGGRERRYLKQAVVCLHSVPSHKATWILKATQELW
ncbi:rCG37312 [Rattus norvegicus]|uniref:RCG37312 n=1 Tax=Rattus norvegicus TaxID=10116 RepID=A6KI35_RAT|nr:rCG37312 [Rattus norvegicus]